MSAAQLSEELAELKPDYLYLPLTEIPNAAGCWSASPRRARP